jgi:fumarate hydratase class II
MPGKVNPVIAESVTMAAVQVIGNDTSIAVAGQAGNFELLVMFPVMTHNLLQSIDLLAKSAENFSGRCVEGLVANKDTCEACIEKSLAMCTALVPAIGYEPAAAIAKESYKTGQTVRELARSQRILPEAKIKGLLDPWRMTGASGFRNRAR